MRNLLRFCCAWVGLIAVTSGCFGKKSEQPPAIYAPFEYTSTNALGSDSKFIVLPDEDTRARVAFVNAKLRFVVLTFPLSEIATLNQTLAIYRNDKKVGEVKITNWQSNESIVADVLSGEAQKGDEVREK